MVHICPTSTQHLVAAPSILHERMTTGTIACVGQHSTRGTKITGKMNILNEAIRLSALNKFQVTETPPQSNMFKVCNLSGVIIVIACPRHQKTQLCHCRLGMNFQNVMPQREVEFRNIPRHRRQTVYVQTHFFFCIFKGDATLFTLSMKWAIIFLFT